MKSRLMGVLSFSLILLGCLAIAGYVHINYLGQIKQQIAGSGILPTSPGGQPNQEDFSIYTAEMLDESFAEAVSGSAALPEHPAELKLEIPKMRLLCDVSSGITDDVLKKGAGLYPEAGSLRERNHNISIAGHRDIYGAEFYNLDKLGEGDSIILWEDGSRYVYSYEFTRIIESSDTSLLDSTDECIITLISCHPVGTSEQRIAVRGRLSEVWLKEAGEK